MIKIPCGGFKLDENFFGMNENDELSLAGGKGEDYETLNRLGGKVKWGRSPFCVTITINNNGNKIKCDTDFNMLAMLMVVKVPITAYVVKEGLSADSCMQFQATQIALTKSETGELKIIFIVLIANDLGNIVAQRFTYNPDGSFSEAVG